MLKCCWGCVYFVEADCPLQGKAAFLTAPFQTISKKKKKEKKERKGKKQDSCIAENINK